VKINRHAFATMRVYPSVECDQLANNLCRNRPISSIAKGVVKFQASDDYFIDASRALSC
jgi:hypothetical protein